MQSKKKKNVVIFLIQQERKKERKYEYIYIYILFNLLALIQKQICYLYPRIFFHYCVLLLKKKKNKKNQKNSNCRELCFSPIIHMYIYISTYAYMFTQEGYCNRKLKKKKKRISLQKTQYTYTSLIKLNTSLFFVGVFFLLLYKYIFMLLFDLQRKVLRMRWNVKPPAETEKYASNQ